MKRNLDQADVEPCSCCGLAVESALASETGGTCEWCAGFPYGPSGCNGKHADELRAYMVDRVLSGAIQPLLAMACVALDDAHHAGRMLSTRTAWIIDRSAPPPSDRCVSP